MVLVTAKYNACSAVAGANSARSSESLYIGMVGTGRCAAGLLPRSVAYPLYRDVDYGMHNRGKAICMHNTTSTRPPAVQEVGDD